MNAARLSALIEQPSIEEIWALHCANMAEYGFDRLLYGFTRFKTAVSFGNREDALILSNHDPEYLKRYFENDSFREAPMVRWSESNAGSCSWEVLRDQSRPCIQSEINHKISRLNAEFDVNSGYTISFRNLAVGGFGAIGLAARAEMSQHEVEQVWRAHGDDILLSNRIMHLRVLTLPSPNRLRLTDRQREVLEWVANGKTIQEVGALIGRKQATVEKHLRLAREAMNAETTAQAVLKASVQNQIFMDTLR